MSKVAEDLAHITPSSDLLFDRIIDVSLLWIEEDPGIGPCFLTSNNTLIKEESDTVHTSTYTGNKIYKNDIEYSAQIFYYKGYSHIEYSVDGRDSKTVKASGGLHTYDMSVKKEVTDFYRGRDPATGNTLGVGERVLVKELNGTVSKYHTVKIHRYYQQETEEGSTLPKQGSKGKYVRKTMAVAYRIKHSIDINTPINGVKPSISFSVNLIPGANCYKLVLKITNLNLDVDIRSVSQIVVKAGYRTLNFMEKYICPVFSSYIETPNPDGVTVFECLCVGQTSSFTTNRPFIFDYLGGSVTIKELINKVSTALGLTSYVYLDPVYLNLSVAMSKMKTFSENATAVITWLRKVIQQAIAVHENITPDNKEGYKIPYPYIMVQVTARGLYVYALNRKNTDEKTLAGITVPSLDMVKGASFNGVALTVKSVWNPRVRPGEIFQMQPTVFNGANLPNSMPRSSYGGEQQVYDADGNLMSGNQYLYRCITASISFSTNDNVNEMTVLAVPIRYMDPSQANFGLEVYKTMETFAEGIRNHYELSTAATITLGEAGNEETKAGTKEEILQSKTNDMFGMNLSSIFPETYKYTIQAGDNLTTLAMQWFDSKSSPAGPSYCPFDLDTSVTNVPQGAYIGPIQKQTLWPLIAVLTYNYYTVVASQKASNNPYEDMHDNVEPDAIRIGKQLVIPKISNMETLKQCREIFKYAADAWLRTHDNYKYLGKWWKSLYQYLGGTWS